MFIEKIILKKTEIKKYYLKQEDILLDKIFSDFYTILN